MRASLLFKIGILLSMTLASCMTVSADNGGYIVTPSTGEYEEWEIVDDGGADGTITFWQLPLWIQISVVSGMLIPAVAVLKYFPLLLGRIGVRRENSRLNEICSYIKENPGCFESQISRDLAIKRGTLRYYIGILYSEKLVFTLKKGKIKGIFHASRSRSTEQNLLCLHLKSDARKTVLDAVVREPGVTRQELSYRLELNKSTIHWHISELLDDEIVHIEKDGRSHRYYPRRDLNMHSEHKNPALSE